MTNRDDLAALISSNVYKYRENTWSLNDDGSDLPGTIADALLARWRLVPVVPSWDDAPPNGYTRGGGLKLPLVPCDTCTAECTCAAQHRAASELTQHDIDAGIYDYHHHDAPMNLNGLPDDQALVTYVTGCACGRTDNHGPHED